MTALCQVFDYLDGHGKRCAIAGAAAMAVHGYVRTTADIDYAVVSGDFHALFIGLRDALPATYRVEIAMPDGSDPLGGVVSISGPDIVDIEVVNFFNPSNPRKNPARAAIEAAVPEPTLDNLPVVTPEYLIALKLYAGSLPDIADAHRLAEAVDSIDWELVDKLAAEYQLEEPLARLTSALS